VWANCQTHAIFFKFFAVTTVFAFAIFLKVFAIVAVFALAWFAFPTIDTTLAPARVRFFIRATITSSFPPINYITDFTALAF
jgi:hypothetical protein